MPQRSKVLMLPETVKADLDRKLVTGGFADYVALSDWLKEQGFEVSKSSLHRYGTEFEQRLSAIKIATDQAQAIADTIGDDQGVLGDALTRLIQEKTFQLLVEMESLSAEDVDFTKLGEMVAKLNKTAILQKKWISDMREKARAAADDVVKVAKAGGLSAEKAEEIRRKILGIV
jgi:phosphohistidine phosphatase SixA